MHSKKKVLITGSKGLIGSALVKRLLQEPVQLLTPDRNHLDLREQEKVFQYFEQHRPHYVFHLAATVGGIHANHTYPAKFIYDNTQMHCNVIHAAHRMGVEKFIFPGSACTYPKLAPQPIPESAFLDGQIEPTNIAYAAAKINGIIMCQSYAREHALKAIIPMPTNAYGIGDNFDPQASHVIPALMQRFHQAKLNSAESVMLWGTGTPLREFIFADDLADAIFFLTKNYDAYDIINVGTMQVVSIEELAHEIAKVVGYSGAIFLDSSKPDGAPRKCLDSTRLFDLGWRPKTSLVDGLAKMYAHHFGQK